MTRNRFQELILMVCLRSENDPTYGATKLNKLLFFSDIVAYQVLCESISGEEYQKLEKGPAPRRLLPEMAELKAAGDICTRTNDVYGYQQRKTFALRDPEWSLFSPQEIDIVGSVIQRFWGKNATDMSNLSHEFIGWQLADMNETIPLSAVFVSDRALTDDEEQYALELA